MASLQPSLKIGLLGGGQLARMLALKGHELGFEMHALSTLSQDPVAQVVQHHHLGEMGKLQDLQKFLQVVDVITFESEFLDAELLQQAAQTTKKSSAIWPHPLTMGVLQDRLSQKNILLASNLPTLPFAPIESLQQAEEFLLKNKRGIVLKQRRFGYDGYGTFHAKSAKELQTQFHHWGHNIPPLIAEPRCAFQRELAISFCRNRSGQVISFPLVESKQVNSRCLWVKGPCQHRQILSLSKKIKKFLKKIDYVGCIAFELFDTGKDLLINEIAPRVHNSAHYSLDALSLDQFSAHLMAIADFDLSTPQSYSKGFAMINLLGKSDKSPAWGKLDDVRLHWYGKNSNRPGRKMGHLTALATTPEKALTKVKSAERTFQL